MTVDGGTNHLYNIFVNDRELYVPDLITGDFDSIRCKVKKYYEEKVCIHTKISTCLILSTVKPALVTTSIKQYLV